MLEFDENIELLVRTIEEVDTIDAGTLTRRAAISSLLVSNKSTRKKMYGRVDFVCLQDIGCVLVRPRSLAQA